ncbi:uncharacterized protein BX663DRAFT_516465 [Cokeromyces recurvatus]|uniref:uncharacterized protein n=1 Tax=Cokeromyces recurvatus TaxID=90255 RepID=UPI002220543A|nr:uncharacterized protein BX663DRAFT_516465 [Cokeromyces recurvatus]KAI7900770.1 hypothetical protein BX663DRAFT_516465 [Cokeromyces recurvatus]
MYGHITRNPWEEHIKNSNHLDELRKSIREQKILLAAATGAVDDDQGNQCNTSTVEDLKRRIISIDKELKEKQGKLFIRGYSTQKQTQWWTRYQRNLRELEDLADQRQILLKESDYLIGTSIKNLEKEIEALDYHYYYKKNANFPLGDNGVTESERIRAKAQAMVAARLNKNKSTTSMHDDSSQKISQLITDIQLMEEQINHIVGENLTSIDDNLNDGLAQIKDRQMFEQGLYVDDTVARFIDNLKRTTITEKEPTITHTLPPLPPSLYSTQPLSPQKPPPPIPTSQRPGTPRSEADIKAAAYKRIEERRKLFIKQADQNHEINKSKTPNKVSDEEKVAQERMRQAELEARARLECMREKRHLMRKEAAEAEEKKKRAAAEAAETVEAEIIAERKRKQLEEEERLTKIKKQQEELAERQRKEREAELEKLRMEQQIQAAERKKREEEERLAEEARQRKARQAAEQAAREKRLRRMEIERREKELEAARQEEINRRKKWEEAEKQKRLEEERRIKEKEEEAEKLKQMLEEEEKKQEKKRHQEDEERKQLEVEEELRRKREEERLRKERLLQEQRLREAEQRLQEEKKREEERKKELYEQEQATARAAEEAKRIEEIAKNSTSSSTLVNAHNFSALNSTTAGNSGYGIDIEDEVNFSKIYRVVTLYEFQGIREDDLSFSANETLKAHPSKDKASDWWYGTSILTNQVGFFPRTYVEIVEEAFYVRTLYEFKKTRPDDLGFVENEIILVQPFQDEESEWWYGTNEDTEESGYFPKSYVERISSSSSNNQQPQYKVTTTSIPIPIKPSSNNYQSDQLTVSNHDFLRGGLSAPNTPIMKKTNLNMNKTQLTKRRRAASTVSTINNSHIGTPQLIIPRSNSISENLELLTWASTMDEIELEAIPYEERKRQEAIFELISTEKTYLNDLQMIINVFYTDSGKYLSQDERDVVFSNIDDLLLCNTALLSDLESRQREEANVINQIGDIFLNHADSLKCYSMYCRNQSYASKFLQKKREEDQWFDVFLKTAQNRPECRSLDLSHFLLEPVQRITRYPLLLRQILNCTSKKHPDYTLVRSSLSIAQRILEDVNEETRRYESSQKVSELTRIIDMEATGRLNIPGREFVMDGVLFKAKSGRKLHGYLFNDILILAEPLKTLNQKGYLYSLYREPMPLERVSVRQQQTISLKASFGSSNTSDDLSFQIVTINQVIAVKAASAAQKRQWISQIQHYSALQQYK